MSARKKPSRSATTLQDIPKAITGGVARLRLPTVYSVDPFIAAGGLVVNGFNTVRLFANAATFVDRILKGRKPA